MGYNYQTERPKLFTESGQLMFIAIRATTKNLLKVAGAFRQEEILLAARVSGDNWLMVACLDRLIELGEIVELPRECWMQYKVYSTTTGA